MNSVVELIREIENYLSSVPIGQFIRPFGQEENVVDDTVEPADDDSVAEGRRGFLKVEKLGEAEISIFKCRSTPPGSWYIEIRVEEPQRRDLVCRLRFPSTRLELIARNNEIDSSVVDEDAIYSVFYNKSSNKEFPYFRDDEISFSEMEIGFFEPDIVKTQLNNCSIGNK